MNDKLMIVKNGVRHVIPYMYSIDGMGDITIRAKAEKRAYAHGGTLSGDGYIDTKKLKLKIDIKADTQAAHDKAVNELIAIFMGRDYQLVNERMDSYYNIASVENIKHDYQKGFKNRWSDIEFNLIMTDPFRYGINDTMVSAVIESSNVDSFASIKILNIGSVDTPLRITLSPAVNMPSVEITHVESGRKCKLVDSLLTAPQSTIIDSKTGTVYREKINAINAFSGQFLHASSGYNTYQIITAQGGSVKLSLRPRWLV